MFKRHADLMEKLTAGALLVGMLQEQPAALLLGIVAYAWYWFFHIQAKKREAKS